MEFLKNEREPEVTSDLEDEPSSREMQLHRTRLRQRLSMVNTEIKHVFSLLWRQKIIRTAALFMEQHSMMMVGRVSHSINEDLAGF